MIDATFTAANPPAPGLSPSSYWARWSGYITFPQAVRFELVTKIGMKVVLRDPEGAVVPLIASSGRYSTPSAVRTDARYGIVVSNNNPMPTVFLRWRTLGGSSPISEIVVPQSALSPAVAVPPTPQITAYTELSGRITARWSLPGGAAATALYRGVEEVDTWRPLSGPGAETSRTDEGLPEGVTIKYAVKAGAANPVTGGMTLGAAGEAIVRTGRSINLDVSATGDGKATLFWNSPGTPFGFNVYRSATPGQLGTLATVTPITPIFNRPGATPIYRHSITGLTRWSNLYFTVIEVDAANGEVRRSEQREVLIKDAGVAWDDPNPSVPIEQLRREMASAIPDWSGMDEFTVYGPDGVEYHRRRNGSVETSVPTQTYDQATGVFRQGSDEGRSVPFDDSSLIGDGPYRRPEGWGIFRRVQTAAGSEDFGLRAVITLPGTNQLAQGSAAYVYTGGQLNDGRGALDMGLGLTHVLGNAQANPFWRLVASSTDKRATGNGTPSGWYQAKNRKIRTGAPTLLITYEALTARMPRYGDGLVACRVSGFAGDVTDENGVTVASAGLIIPDRNYSTKNAGWDAGLATRGRGRFLIKRTNSIAQRTPPTLLWPPSRFFVSGDHSRFAAWGYEGGEDGVMLASGVQWSSAAGVQSNVVNDGSGQGARVRARTINPFFAEDTIDLDTSGPP